MSHFWEKFSDEQLLDLRLCDLAITLESSPRKKMAQKLYRELSSKGLAFKPHFWVSDDWFCPDGIPGISVPFYSLHPRLIKLERKMMGRAEGATEHSFMKLLRHECGHAIDNAFRLRGDRQRVNLFGRSSDPYPKSYTYRPYSRAFVRHIGEGYAQAHPEEDWAETFAVWLTPKSNWKIKYQGWGALKKLQYLDQKMKLLKSLLPFNQNTDCPWSIDEQSLTLRKYYAKKVRSKGMNQKRFFGKRIDGLFSSHGNVRSDTFLKEKSKKLGKKLAGELGLYQYEIEPLLKELLLEVRQQNLYINSKKSSLDKELSNLLAKEAGRFKRQGRDRVIM